MNIDNCSFLDENILVFFVSKKGLKVYLNNETDRN